MRTKRFFLNRIGKRIFRDKTSCPCHTCTKNFEEGLIIGNKQHAIYLYDVQFDGEKLNYRDKK